MRSLYTLALGALLSVAGCIVCNFPVEPAQLCGGIAAIPCEEGFVCVDDPNDDCDPENGGADCGGICVEQEPGCGHDGDCDEGEFCDFTQINSICAYDIECGTCAPKEEPTQCGGIAGLPCEPGETCVDDPNDDCDPNNGGADCGGICVPAEPGCGHDGDCGADEFCDFSQVNPICAYDIECGTCAPKPLAQCGGFAGLPCEAGFVCVDDPDDCCDPQNGGADCPGICIPEEPCGDPTAPK